MWGSVGFCGVLWGILTLKQASLQCPRENLVALMYYGKSTLAALSLSYQLNGALIIFLLAIGWILNGKTTRSFH